MSQLEVKIVDLPPMRVASALGFGTEPEDQATKLLYAFAEERNIDMMSDEVQTFGFNNPNPTPGSPNYGYELWLRIGPDVEASKPIEIKEVPGNKYAVTRFTGLSNIGRVWRELAAWFEESCYMFPPNYCQCLEALLNRTEPDPEKWIFDLYFPITS
jgi:effector-binding domain-containing protein